MCCTGPTHVILLAFFTIAAFSEEYKLWYFSVGLCHFLNPPVTSAAQKFMYPLFVLKDSRLVFLPCIVVRASHLHKTTRKIVVFVGYILIISILGTSSNIFD